MTSQITESAPVVVVSSDTHIGPYLKDDLRAYCPQKYLPAFDDYVRGRGLTPIIDPHRVRSMEGRAIALAQRWGSRNPIPWTGVR